MAIKFTSVKCPDCGANLPIEQGRKTLFCSYCGAQIIVTNENEYIYHHIDEARIKEAEVNSIIELKKLEIIERKRASSERIKKIKIIISVIMGIVGVILMIAGVGMGGIVGLLVLEGVMFIWIFSDKDKENDDIDFGEKVKVPSDIDDYKNKNYTVIKEKFRKAGFTNIKCMPLRDLRFGILKKTNTVESITIDGKEFPSNKRKYSPDASVIISYHSLSGKRGVESK